GTLVMLSTTSISMRQAYPRALSRATPIRVALQTGVPPGNGPPLVKECCAARMLAFLGHLIERLAGELRAAGFWWGGGLSVVLAVGSLVLAVAIVVAWPADHFKDGRRAHLWEQHHPVVRAFGLAAKNLAGLILLLLGFVMALPGIPGQGILTMIIAVTLLD